jgi:hypothetical protein
MPPDSQMGNPPTRRLAGFAPWWVLLETRERRIVRSRVLPAWLGWSGAAVAPLLVANGFDLGAEFGPAFILFLLWTLITVIVVLRRAATSHAALSPVAKQP